MCRYLEADLRARTDHDSLKEPGQTQAHQDVEYLHK